MLKITNFLNIQRLFLTWQRLNGQGTRYVVGTLTKDSEGNCNFSYSNDTKDFNDAIEQGFNGFPAFNTKKVVHNNSLETFMKRLPPKNRKDFKKYLVSHYLPEEFAADDMTLLAHTSAKLPSDGFTLIPDLADTPLPFDYVMEVAGTRHHITNDELKNIPVGCHVDFVLEDENEKDANAIALMCQGIKVGYVNRLLCLSFRKLLESRQISAELIKVKSDDERSLMYVLIRASEIES